MYSKFIFPFIYQRPQVAPAFIYYSLKRECLVVIDHTFEEWADPDGFLRILTLDILQKIFMSIPT